MDWGTGTSVSGPRWVAGGRQFLFPVRALSKMFRGKFLAGLEQWLADKTLDLPESFSDKETALRQLLRRLSRKPWVVYSKAPFAGSAKLLDYLSRYTHCVAVSNHRLVSRADGEVTFHYRDRADGDRRQATKLPAYEFIHRFLAHVLPARFMRIRHDGFLANCHKTAKLAQIRQLLGATAPTPVPPTPTAEQWLREVLGIDTTQWPCCGEPLVQTRLTPLPDSNVLLACFPKLTRPSPRGPPPRPT